MASKRYPKLAQNAVLTQPLIRESKAEAYGREKGEKEIRPSAISISSLKRKWKRPAKRNRREIAWALEIAGIGEGPQDLSRNMREYLASNK